MLSMGHVYTHTCRCGLKQLDCQYLKKKNLCIEIWLLKMPGDQAFLKLWSLRLSDSYPRPRRRLQGGWGWSGGRLCQSRAVICFLMFLHQPRPCRRTENNRSRPCGEGGLELNLRVTPSTTNLDKLHVFLRLVKNRNILLPLMWLLEEY